MNNTSMIYTKIPHDLIERAYKNLGITEHAAFVVQMTDYTIPYYEILEGYADKNDNLSEQVRQERDDKIACIKEDMEFWKSFALSAVKVPTDVFTHNNSGDFSYTFVKCRKGVMTCGVYCKDNINQRREEFTVAILYLLGITNSYEDEILSDSVNCLVSQKGSDAEFYNGLVIG